MAFLEKYLAEPLPKDLQKFSDLFHLLPITYQTDITAIQNVYDHGNRMGAARLRSTIPAKVRVQPRRIRPDIQACKAPTRRSPGRSSGSRGRAERCKQCRDRSCKPYERVRQIFLGVLRLTDFAPSEVDDDLKEYDLEHYDDDDVPVEDDEMGESGDTMGIFGNIKSLVYHGKDEEDPYITLPANGVAEEDEDEREELQILTTDNMVLAARIEDEVAHLEVYVYEDSADNLYVHHDVMLPAIPLAVEWLDFPVGRKDAPENGHGNFVAVGTMDPDIELWDLDIVDCMYPNAILGQGGKHEDRPKKKKKKSKKARDDYHVDAVLSLAANRQHRNLLASASADKTVKLWDLNTATCAKSYSYHTDKVCSIAWHPQESTALLSGSYDRTIIAADMRAPEAGHRKWTVDSDVENVRWDPHDPNFFYVSSFIIIHTNHIH